MTIIVTPSDTHIQLDIPPEYIGRRMEITYQPLDEFIEQPKKKTMADFWGIISDETAEKLHAQVKEMRDEWERDI